jgi:DNA-binding GntR family transcriptional regulator
VTQAAAACEEQLKTGDRVEIFRADSQFHLLLAEFSGNLHLADTLRRLNVKVQLCRMVFCAALPKIKESVRTHQPLVDAIRNHQAAQAERLLREHILQSMRVFLTHPVARA